MASEAPVPTSMSRGLRTQWKNLFARLRMLLRDWRRGGFARVSKRLSGLAHMNIVVLGCVDALPINTNWMRTPAGYELAQAQPHEADEIAGCSGIDPETRTRLGALFREFFAHGHRCVVARSQGRIVGHLWAFAGEYTITVDDYRRTRLPVTLDAQSVFTGNAYIAPAHRNQELFRHLKLHLMRTYPPGTRFYAWVGELNDASLAANRALGFKPLAYLHFTGPAAHPRVELRPSNASAWTIMDQSGARLRIDGDQVLSDAS